MITSKESKLSSTLFKSLARNLVKSGGINSLRKLGFKEADAVSFDDYDEFDDDNVFDSTTDSPAWISFFTVLGEKNAKLSLSSLSLDRDLHPDGVKVLLGAVHISNLNALEIHSVLSIEEI